MALDTVIKTLVDRETADALAALAARHDRSLSAVVRHAILYFLGRKEVRDLGLDRTSH